MNTGGRTVRLWITASLMSGLAMVLAISDRTVGLLSVRMTIHELLSPGRLIVLSVSRQADSAAGKPLASSPLVTPEEIRRLQSELVDSERQRRQLIIENARLRHEQRIQKANADAGARLAPYTAQLSPRSDQSAGVRSLAGFSVLPARVLSSDGLPQRLRHALIDAGASLGVTRSEVVVDGTGLLLDQGSTDRVATGDRVLAGSVVIGRIAKVSRWVSLVQPVTDSRFSARVTLVRTAADGVHFGANGILKGTGDDDCRIDGIPYTEAVSVGDDVVMSDIDGLRSPHLYVGHVTQAVFLDGGQWQIRVMPALSTQQLEHVGIVRMELDGLANSSPNTDAISGTHVRSNMNSIPSVRAASIP